MAVPLTAGTISGALQANAEAVVDEVYGGVLKRQPAALERKHWADNLRSNGSLKGMLAAAIHGVEFQQLVQPVIARGLDAQADLPHLAKRIAIVSNLQGKPIADAMQVLTARRAPTYYQVTPEGLDPGRIAGVMHELLAAHDCVLTQPVIAERVLRLAPELEGRIELFPSVTFAAYHPDVCGVFEETSGRAVMGALGPYHSSIAYFAYRAGMDVRETLKHFGGPVYENVPVLRLLEGVVAGTVSGRGSRQLAARRTPAAVGGSRLLHAYAQPSPFADVSGCREGSPASHG